MTRKKPRRNLSLSQEEGELQIQTLQMIPDQSQPSQTLSQEEEPELRETDQEELESHEDPQQQDPQDEEQDEPEGNPSSPPAHGSTIADLIPENPPHMTSKVSRKASKRKKPVRYRNRAALEKKLQVLKQNLQPIPFVPNKTLDFSKHEKLFKRLGLWDFAHLEFDRSIRTDLVAQLISNFNSQLRCSFVNELRIMVNRADLARALKLPVKKDKIIPSKAPDSESEVLSEESISFIVDFVSNWILLHEDAWMMPDEVLTGIRFIKDGQPQKVDWPGLIWFMVEKELMQAPQLEHCYYASHLQCLMKFQRGSLFIEQPKVEISIKDEEDATDVIMSGSNVFREQEFENQPIELSLGQDNIESEQVRDEDIMDFQECKEEEPGQWLLDGKNNVGEHFLQHCDLNGVGGLECQAEMKQELEEEERYDLSPRCTTMERVSSADVLHSMGATNIPDSAPAHLLDPSSGDFLASRADTYMNLNGPSMFGNGYKREVSPEDGVHHRSLHDLHERMRNDGPWEQKSSEFDVCIEHVQSWMVKARMMYEEKEQACRDSQINQQMLLNDLEQRDAMIRHLERTKREELQKREVEIHHLELDLYLMGNLIDNYKKALKETRQAFFEYRKCCQQPEEPLYKDAGGTGGFVLSTMELEKQQLERAEEDRIKRSIIEEQIKDFQLAWRHKYEVHLGEVDSLGKRLLDFEKEMKFLKEKFAEHKISET